MITLLITRHGQTDLNQLGVFRGRLDIELNENGLKQTGLLSDTLANSGITKIYSSPLKRSLTTADIIATRLHLPVTSAGDLIDIDYGLWQGLSYQEVKERYAVEFSKWINTPQQLAFPGGESLNEVLQRIQRFINVIKDSDNVKVLLISHLAVDRIIMCYLLGLDISHFWNFEFDNCALTTFSYNKYGLNGFILEKHNDTSFLK